MPRDAPRVRDLVTPEGVPLALTLADMGQRLGALVIDMLVLLGAFVGFSLLLLLAGFAIGREAAGRAALVLWLLGGFVLRNFYFAALEGGPRGATIGKRAMKLRVVARHGGRLTLDAVIARNAMREVELYMPLTFLAARLSQDGADGWLAAAGLAWSGVFLALPFLNRDRLRAGDLLAGTWVIRAPRHPLLPDLAEETTHPEAFTSADLARYGNHELDVLAEVLRAAEPDSLATAAETIRLRIGRRWRPPDQREDLIFLKAYYAALRGHLENGLLQGVRRPDKFDR